MTAAGADRPLTGAGLAAAVDELTARDPDLAEIVARHGLPPLWDRRPGFPTLVHIVLEQQVSLASARAAFVRLEAATDPLTPARFLALADAQLLAIGFSRQKARYGRALASAIETGKLDLDGLVALDDEDVHAELQAVPGIGPWTSTIYLLMVLGRPDVWPVGDMALATAVGEVKGLGRRPAPPEMTAIGEAWRPWGGGAGPPRVPRERGGRGPGRGGRGVIKKKPPPTTDARAD
jgi:DNA-3-methyladenine glycosylase II